MSEVQSILRDTKFWSIVKAQYLEFLVTYLLTSLTTY